VPRALGSRSEAAPVARASTRAAVTRGESLSTSTHRRPWVLGDAMAPRTPADCLCRDDLDCALLMSPAAVRRSSFRAASIVIMSGVLGGTGPRRPRASRAAAVSRRGTYGECRVCSEPIDERRLRLLPDADLCAVCAGRW